MIQKKVKITFWYEFLLIIHPKSHMLKPQKSHFSEILTFSILNMRMSYSKYEFLSVKTQSSDVNEHCSTFNDEFLTIYGL